MRTAFPLLLLVLTSTGCTTMALKRHALSQAATPTDIRYQEVLDNLAMVADNPAVLPAYSSIFAGTAQITDTSQLISTTGIGMGATSSLIIAPQFTRGIVGTWSLDPINAPEKLEALRDCCRWVIYGPEAASRDCPGLLNTPEQAPSPGRHFGVADRLAKLPPGWLRVGRDGKACHGAAYRACAGRITVAVMPEDVRWLADFCVIIQDIARVDINSLTLFYIQPEPSDFTFPTCPKSQCCGNTQGPKPRAAVVAAVKVDSCGRLMPDKAYYPWRVDNVGTDAALRSQISAAAAGLR